jgi:uncharacterized Fe-S radical SAM superfamily protein PflX
MIVPGHYCANLHAGLQISLKPGNQVAVSTCVLADQEYTVTDHRVFDHPQLIEFRNSNQTNQQLESYCTQCEEMACTGRRGRNRSSSNINYIKDQLLYRQAGPKIITFKLDYTCNLACVTCGPELSTKWRGITKIKRLPVQANEELIRQTIRNINLEQLETVHIFGGEPLLTRTHEIILEELSAYSKNITVWYDTNATVYPSKRTLELWDQFHLIRLKFSIDGVGKSFEYLRWPAVWSQVEDNILRMHETLPVNHMLSVRPAMGFLNFHIVKDIRDWQQQVIPTNRLGDLTEFEYTPVYGLYNASNMTKEMIDELHTIYSADDPIFEILAPQSNNQDSLRAIRKQLEKLDAARGLDYRTALPHLVPYLNTSS